MKIDWRKGVFALLLTWGLIVGPAGFGASDVQPPKQEKEENLITTWMQLALLGKNQAEIEYYFIRNQKREKIGEVKQMMRSTVMDNLRRSNIRYLISHASDSDDLNVVVNKIITEIRYMGMEHDEDLKISIKEEFGVQLDQI